jgi:flavin reductase (DIM6/NTAB) family NADH-FMN oxidoreductase RutF
MLLAAPVVTTGLSAAAAVAGTHSSAPAIATAFHVLLMQSPPSRVIDRSTGGNTRGSVRVAVQRGGYEGRVDAAATFRALVGSLEYPMFIVTARGGEEPLGCLVGFATQTSIDPPRFLVCLSHTNRTYRRGRDSELLGVHCVPEHAVALAELFGGETGDDFDKFARCAWREGPGGVPLLDECPNRFVGRVLWRRDAGDHDAFLLEPVLAEKGAAGDEFTFRRARRIEPGHEA